MRGLIVAVAALPLLLAGNACGSAQYTVTDVGTLGGDHAYAMDVNGSGEVLAYSYLAGNALTHAFLYSTGTKTDLGALPGYRGSIAYSINAGGQAAGYCGNPGSVAYRACLFIRGTMIDLGNLGGTWSRAIGVNAKGQVVGDADIAGSVGGRAFLYSNGTMTNINNLISPASGWTLETAEAINDSGQVVGQAKNAFGRNRGFLFDRGAITDLGDLGGSYCFCTLGELGL